ncbi:MAG: EamA family transporter [Firmicutes bacterium]|nr:EamA family transporter [Bacillota bacterium]
MVSIYLLFLPLTLLASLGSFCFKKGAAALDTRRFARTFLGNGYLYLGGVLYLAAALLNIHVLRFLPYSIVVPLTAVMYIWTMMLSRAFLGEKITPGKLAGVVCIIIGSVLLVW